MSLELSVIVLTRGRGPRLDRCLQALSEQGQASNTFEIHVANDAEHSSRAAALAAAIEAASGPSCLILDEELTAAPSLLAHHIAAHRSDEPVLAVGRVIESSDGGGDWYTRAHARDMNRTPDGSRLDWSAAALANFSAPRAELRAAAESSPLQPADPLVELAFRLWCRGCRVTYVQDAEAARNEDSPASMLRARTRQNGHAYAQLAQAEPAMMPKLVGSFLDTTNREVILRRAMLLLRVSPAALARLGALMPGRQRRDIWYRFVSRLEFWRGVRAEVSRDFWVRLTHGVPVLLYHAFGAGADDARYIVSRQAFARQMRLLAALRYRVISVDDLARDLRDAQLPPRRSAVITIDDGYVDNLEIADPILRQAGFPATIFLVSDLMGRTNDWAQDPTLRGRPLLSTDQVLGARDGVLRFGVHTRTHASLPKVSDEQVRDEVEGSRSDLERMLGFATPTFAYPFGDYDERSLAAIRRAEFTAALTTHPRRVRPDDDPALIPRIEIARSDSVARFLIKLWFGVG